MTKVQGLKQTIAIMSLPDFEAWAAFVAVAEQGSLAAAAREMGVSVPTISRAVARLEARLGGSLFHRTSRRLSLSQFGADALPEAQALLGAAQELEARLTEASATPAGRVRFAAPMEFGRALVAPLLPEFLAAHPAISIDLHLDDARIDLVAEGHDLLLRIGLLADSSLIARRLCTVARHLVAAPAYLAAHGAPQHPADLARHRALLYTHMRPPDLWRLNGPDNTEWSVTLTSTLAANSGGALIPAAVAGAGIALLPDFLIWEELRAGTLVPLLPGWTTPPLALHLVTPPGRRRPNRVRLLMDWLTNRLAHAPWANGAPV